MLLALFFFHAIRLKISLPAQINQINATKEQEKIIRTATITEDNTQSSPTTMKLFCLLKKIGKKPLYFLLFVIHSILVYLTSNHMCSLRTAKYILLTWVIAYLCIFIIFLCHERKAKESIIESLTFCLLLIIVLVILLFFPLFGN